MQFFCPACFAELPASDPEQPCPHCGVVASAWEAGHSYTERLIHALGHPNPEARMGAILTLGNQAEVRAAIPLAQCALAHPIDVVQSLEIVRSLHKLPTSPERAVALALLIDHPARAVRRAAMCETATVDPTD